MAASVWLRSLALRGSRLGSPRLSGSRLGSPRLSGSVALSPAPRCFCSAPEERRSGIVESTEEYRFVERLIPPSRVPAPPKHTGPTPSGWVPPAETPPDLPYMIRRSRMHNIPVYADMTHGNRRMTLVKKVEGDIRVLERDVRQFLKDKTGKELPTQVNEVTGTLKVKGHYDVELKQWLAEKGF